MIALVIFLRAVRRATLTAEARVVKAGAKLGNVKVRTGKLVAPAASTLDGTAGDGKDLTTRNILSRRAAQ